MVFQDGSETHVLLGGLKVAVGATVGSSGYQLDLAPQLGPGLVIMASLLLVHITCFVTLNGCVMAFIGCHELGTEKEARRNPNGVIKQGCLPGGSAK